MSPLRGCLPLFRDRVRLFGVLFFFFSLLIPAALPAIGIALKSGEYFVADLVEDQIDHFLIRYEGRLYRIPVGEIARVQMGKDRPDRLTRLELKDGQILEGRIIDLRGDVLEIETKNGPTEINNNQIASRNDRKEAMVAPPNRFAFKAQADRPSGPRASSLGLFAYGGGNFGEFSDSHRSLGSAGIIWEPSFVSFAPGGLGLRLEYAGLPHRRLPIEIGSAFLTLYFYFPDYSFYFDFGAGGALIQYIRSRTRETGPTATLGFGYRSSGGERFYWKAGLRGQYIRSRFGGVSNAGIELVGVWKY